MEKDTGSFEDIARNKLAQAIDDLESADILLGAYSTTVAPVLSMSFTMSF